MTEDAPDPPVKDETDVHAERRADLNRRLRAAFLAGAEEQSQHAHGRGLTEEESEGVLGDYPGDLPATLPDVPAGRPASRKPRTVTLPTSFHGRQVILIPNTTTPDWPLFTAACDAAVRSLAERGGTPEQLRSTINREGAKWMLRAHLIVDTRPNGSIEIEIVDR